MRKLIFLAIGMFAVGCNTYQIAGLLPAIGLTIREPLAITGQGMTVFSLTYLFSAPFFSIVFANKPMKPVIQLSLIIFIIGNIITLFSGHILMFLLGRSLSGVGAGIFTPLCITSALHLMKATHKGRALSFIWGASSAGVVFGVPLSLFLSSLLNWQISIAYLITLSLLSLIGLSWQHTKITLTPSPPTNAKHRFFFNKETLSVISVTSLTGVASLGLFSYISAILADSPNSLPMIVFSWGLGGLIGSSLIGTLIDRTNNPKGIMACLILGLSLSMLLIPLTEHFIYGSLIPIFLWGIFGWATTNPQQQILFKLHNTKAPLLAAINSSALGLGAALGTMIGGLCMTAGFKVVNLPFLASFLLLLIFLYQLFLIKQDCYD
jgi:predicted MFS family arabinose efflux permease